MGAEHGRAVVGDGAAFRTLYERHVADVWRYARRRTASVEDADDVTAECFAVAWRRRRDLPPEDEVRLWLFGTARRVVANRRRSGRRRDRLHLRLAAAGASGLAASPAADEGLDGPAAALWAALATLSEDDRELLFLRAWDGLAVTDLATLLGCTPNAASLRLHKARARLAAALADAADEGSRTDPAPSWTSPDRSPQPEGGIP